MRKFVITSRAKQKAMKSGQGAIGVTAWYLRHSSGMMPIHAFLRQVSDVCVIIISKRDAIWLFLINPRTNPPEIV